MFSRDRDVAGVVLGHPTGNQFFRQLAASVREAGRLAEVCTAIDWRGGGLLGRVLPGGLKRELERRSFSRELGVPVAQRPWREWLRLAASRLDVRGLTSHERGIASVDAVYRDFDAWLACRLSRVQGGGVVYAYEDAAEATFLAARALGWARVYDLPIAYWETSRRLLAEEARRWPEWEPTLVGTRDSEEKCARKTRELGLADAVVCPSRFVAESLPPGTAERSRVIVAPFGSPSAGPPPAQRRAGARLRVLFAGSMSQRKGLADLFAAWRLIGSRAVELVVLGTPIAELGFYRAALADFIHEAPRPHADVLALMRTCDVLCLPSIVEGRALVVQEAMSQGLPVIVTPNTGTDDAVEDGQSGFVVPIRAPEALAEKITWLASNREAAREMGVAAQRGAERFSWQAYGATVVRALPEKPRASSARVRMTDAEPR